MKIFWDGEARLEAAVMVDVDGTLASLYSQGRRALRSGALEALRSLAVEAPVFLWSAAGAENGERLLEEYPQLSEVISGCFGKDEAPLARIAAVYCIDDELIDPAVLECRYELVAPCEGEAEAEPLLRAAEAIVEQLRSRRRT